MKINDLLFLKILSDEQPDPEEEYKSRIAEVGSDTIYIEIPIHTKTGRFKKLNQGDALYAYFVTGGGIKNYFNTQVLGYIEEKIRLVVLKKPAPEDISKIQRRSYLRVPADLDVALESPDGIKFLGISRDVSGGGLSFLHDGLIPVDESMQLSGWVAFSFKNEMEHIPFALEVLRTEKLETGRILVFTKFIKIAETDRAKIIRYCFARQLELRKQ